MSVAPNSINGKASFGFEEYCVEQKNHKEQIIHHKEKINKHNEKICNHKEQILDKIECARDNILSKLSKEDVINFQKLCSVENTLINFPPSTWAGLILKITLAAIGALCIVGTIACIPSVLAATSIPVSAFFGELLEAIIARVTAFTLMGGFGFGCSVASIPLISSIYRGVNLLKKSRLEKNLGNEKLELYNQLVKLSADQAIYKQYRLGSKKVILPESGFEHKKSYLISDASVYAKPVQKKN